MSLPLFAMPVSGGCGSALCPGAQLVSESPMGPRAMPLQTSRVGTAPP